MKLPYDEGDWVCVPLEGGGYALGIIARAGKRGRVLIGYFFGPHYAEIPGLENTQGLKPADAVLICQFGDLGLIDGSWPILGRERLWNREEWPMPRIVRKELSGRIFEVTLNEDDPAETISETQIDSVRGDEIEDRMSGSVAVGIHLAKLLSK